MCLKQFSGGYVLGVSNNVQELHLWFIPELQVALNHYEEYVGVMVATGTPFRS